MCTVVSTLLKAAQVNIEKKEEANDLCKKAGLGLSGDSY